MSEPFLSQPSLIYRDSYIAAWRELAEEGRFPSWNFDMLTAHFDEYLDVIRARETDPLPGFVPESTYWLIVGDQYVGTISIRHYLTPALRRFGGHIGYIIRPSYRGQGYGTLQCRLALNIARSMGLTRALITCDDNNVGSYKIIEANGGVLLDRVDNRRGVLTRRYWVDLSDG